MNDPIVEYWQGYLATLPADHAHRSTPFTAWGFGDSARMRDELGALVKQGTKTATASLGWEYEHEGQTMPQPGDISIILDGEEKPMCIIETTEIRILPFNGVDAQFAYDEGEGDRSLAFWRDAHWRYFGRVCEAIGRERSETMPIVCERFRKIWG